jgi:hypothetical protein
MSRGIDGRPDPQGGTWRAMGTATRRLGIVAGLGRAGTTWLHRQLELEPAVFTPPQKDVWYFDRFFDRGPEWYFGHFDDAPQAAVPVDVSHDYFFHPLAPMRIVDTCRDVRVLIVLREPVSWSLSVCRREAATRHRRGTTVRQAFDANLGTSACALFSNYVRLWQSHLGDRVTFLLYDDMRADVQRFWGDVADALGFDASVPAASDVINDTKQPRLPGAYQVAAKAGEWLRARGMASTVGTIKRHSIVQRVLMSDHEFEPHGLSTSELNELRAFYLPDVVTLGELLGEDLVARWGYE